MNVNKIFFKKINKIQNLKYYKNKKIILNYYKKITINKVLIILRILF